MKKPIKQSKAAKPAKEVKPKIVHPLVPTTEQVELKKLGNRDIKDFVNKGLAAQKAVDQVIKEAAPKNYAEKQINVLLLAHESKAIDTLRALRPVTRRNAKRLAISIHDWIVEAIQEKIKKDFEANGLQMETTNGVHQEG